MHGREPGNSRQFGLGTVAHTECLPSAIAVDIVHFCEYFAGGAPTVPEAAKE